MRTPSFRYMGGKARLRSWLVPLFPQSGRRYLEPFAGLGNIYYHARKHLRFERWVLSDRDPAFLKALLEANLSEMPESVSRTEFEHWRHSGCSISKLIEPKVTFAGKGYPAGFDGGHASHPAYTKKWHLPLCEEARRLLEGTKILKKDWASWDFSAFPADDFVYLDPPYYGTKASYPNIDHEALIAALNRTKCRWAISGYESPLYEKKLKYVRKFQKERNGEIRGANSGKYEATVETLWTNY
jgi:site-specific DNA-adenine methylase